MELTEKRPEIYQVTTPFFHEDGDMIEMYLSVSPISSSKVRLQDYGMTAMRLSYVMDIDTPSRERIFNQIIESNNFSIEKGNIYIDIDIESTYPAAVQLSQVIAKASSMKLYQREVI